MESLLLDKIDQPSDLKKLNAQQVEKLCAEIRHFMLENISKTGGHLASNLGTLQRRVADHFLQVHILQKGSVFLAYIDPLGNHLVQHLCLFTGLVPDAHGIVHGDDSHHTGHRKNRRGNPGAASGNNIHVWGRRRNGAGAKAERADLQ